MRNKLDFTKRALVLGGLLIGTATVALAPSAANARNFIGVDVGPLSVGIGANEPDYYYAPAPQTYVAPPAAYTPPPPVTYQAPVTTYQAPVTTYQVPVTTYQTPATTTTTTTYYNYPSETTTYYSYRPGLVPRATETATTYYGQ
jgi:hypothetical protein